MYLAHLRCGDSSTTTMVFLDADRGIALVASTLEMERAGVRMEARRAKTPVYSRLGSR